MEKLDDVGLFSRLAAIDCTKFIEKLEVGKKSYSYLSWAHAWSLFCQNVQNPSYKILKEKITPYGIMVYTKVSAEGITHKMWLPVLDGANKPMRLEPYTYEVEEYNYGNKTGNKITKKCDAANMFDINTAQMRCLVKNLAMFGLGINVYAGEDLPLVKEDKKPPVDKKVAPKEAPPKKPLPQKDVVMDEKELEERVKLNQQLVTAYNNNSQALLLADEEKARIIADGVAVNHKGISLELMHGRVEWINKVVNSEESLEEREAFTDADFFNIENEMLNG